MSIADRTDETHGGGSMDRFISKRLDDMAARPALWASTRMEFALQLALLVEMWLVLHGLEIRPGWAIDPIVGVDPDDDLTGEWAANAVAAAREMMR